MSEYLSNTTLNAMASTIHQADTILITTHEKPDGDALGSVIALALALIELDKKITPVLVEPVPAALDFLMQHVPVTVLESEQEVLLCPDDFDLNIVVDTGAWSQLSTLKAWLAPLAEKTILIDHHRQGDAELAQQRFIETSAAACTELIADLIDHLGVEINPWMGEAIYTGLTTDTGSFRYSNTTSNTLKLAARLLDIGVDHAGLTERLEQQDRVQRYALMRVALNTQHFYLEDQLSVMSLMFADFEEANASPSDCEGFVNMPLTVRQTQVSVLLVEKKPGFIKMSFRSKPSPNAVDVSELAGRFGGGGHSRAAGGGFEGEMDTCREAVINAVREALD